MERDHKFNHHSNTSRSKSVTSSMTRIASFSTTQLTEYKDRLLVVGEVGGGNVGEGSRGLAGEQVLVLPGRRDGRLRQDRHETVAAVGIVGAGQSALLKLVRVGQGEPVN